MNMEALALFHKAGPNSVANVPIPQPGGTENDNNNSAAPRKMPPPVPTTQQPLRSKDVQQS